MERRVAVIRSNRVDGPALACTVAVPFGGTLGVELSIIAAPKTHFGLSHRRCCPEIILLFDSNSEGLHSRRGRSRRYEVPRYP